ncbi:Fatty acid metabolism regulator protein [Streptomyces sp. YIM 130001]|uniref:TetR/AcrR family transcriptional regulator n=1 Tax=Streptomyces sp. YIM 130001 TaxID=2259644 RepID=UPI000E64C245|nr:TetR family transcriptional regulator [Streptomyces sp. YIM 130001]RII13460.1 Fatty acid metabolism regulator protein [Streptomyces sp. YIM 130001]
MHSDTVAQTQAGSEARLGLRERKKLRTRQMIREAARGLIDAQGYEHTTVEQIAAAAEVSPSTVFRYFPNKEQIVLRDEDYAESGIDFLRSRPLHESPLVALRQALTAMARTTYQEFNADYRWRMELVRTVPALRAQMYESQERTITVLTGALAERTGRPANDLELRALVGAMTGGLHQVVLDWGDHGQQGDLPEMIDRVMAVLERGLTPQDA